VQVLQLLVWVHSTTLQCIDVSLIVNDMWRGWSRPKNHPSLDWHHLNMVEIVLTKFQTLRIPQSHFIFLSTPTIVVDATKIKLPLALPKQENSFRSISKTYMYLWANILRITHGLWDLHSYLHVPPQFLEWTSINTASPCYIYLFKQFRTLYKVCSVGSAKKSSLSSSPRGK